MLPRHGLMNISNILNAMTGELKADNDRAYAKTDAYIAEMADYRASIHLTNTDNYDHHDSVKSVLSFAAGRVSL